ncbi:Wall-associated receptor kinase, galacturonan-binding domain containing protein [Trema orientale]|uniref:Wall-associated receptor kinase, galacturonan-binding domain containing protein n=1 Tax=Trema orientale TaxID=63057 RepID=A0A2P5EVG2_TREOI|nr:Wall-associated receptor kinase, galacturonan-binding domain containing protein [Trema orientale]
MVMILLVFILVSRVSAFNYITCPKCGNFEVPYPFSTDDNCGDLRYKVSCNNGNLEFPSAEGFHYKILSINPTTQKLIIRPPMILEDTCYSSDFPQGGLRLDERSPFNISTHNTVLLLNCTAALLRSPLNCSFNSFCRQFENEKEEGSGCKSSLCCHYLKDSSMTSHFIRVRPGGCTAYTSVVDIKPEDPIDQWNYGIELQWLPPN